MRHCLERKEVSVTTDIDGVVCDLNTAVLKQIWNMWQIYIPRFAITTFDAVPELVYKYTHDSSLSHQTELLYTDPNVLLSAKPYKGFVFLVNLLQSMNIPVSAITSRPPNNRQTTEKWLNKHELSRLGQNLYIRDPQSDLPGEEFKLRTIQNRIHPTPILHIEDQLSTAQLIGYYGHRVALIDRPWNQNNPIYHPLNQNLHRHYGWPSILMGIVGRIYL